MTRTSRDPFAPTCPQYVCWHTGDEDPVSQDTSIGPQQALSLIPNLTPSSPAPFSFMMNTWTGLLLLSGPPRRGVCNLTRFPLILLPQPPRLRVFVSGLFALIGKYCAVSSTRRRRMVSLIPPIEHKLGIPVSAEECSHVRRYPDLSRNVRCLKPRNGIS